MTCDHCCNRRLPQLLPAYVWLCNHCGAYVDKAGNPATVTQTQADTVGTVPLADPGPDCATRRADAARDRAAAEPATIARARQLAADYQANPTPARAHNAAQTLSTVLDQLDRARKLNTDMWALIAKLALKSSGKHNAAITDLATQLNMPPLTELPDNTANHWTAINPTAQCPDATCRRCWCGASGEIVGAFMCLLRPDHEGDHSTNAHPNPRTWPQLATGGIVDPNTTHRIGKS